MLLGPHEIARRIQHQHRPGWSVWYGASTRQYWALASWVPGLAGFIAATGPEALETAITTIEILHPKPVQPPR